MIASVSGIFILIVVPLPGTALESDRSTDLLDVGSHDVHADASSRKLRDLVGG